MTSAREDPASMLDNLEEIIQGFAVSLDIGETLEHTLRRLMTTMRTEAASVFLLDEASGELVCAPLKVRDKAIGAIELLNRIPSPDNPDGLFDVGDKQLVSILSSAAALAIHNARMAETLARTRSLQRELEIARRIQESFLPAFEESHPISGINLAAREVSGDFFDYLRLPDGTPADRRVTLANAGHPPAVQRGPRGEWIIHDRRGLPLGILPDQRYEEVRFPLAESSLYLYTDGLSEGLARTKKSEDELESLKSLIDRFTDKPRQQRLSLVANEVFVHSLRFDDLTILLLEERREGDHDDSQRIVAVA